MDTEKCNDCLEKDKLECLKLIKHEKDKLPGSIINYKKISRLIIFSIIINSIFLTLLNIPIISLFMTHLIGILKFEIIKQFFFGSLGGTLTCSLFLSKDMEINAIESAKKIPDPEILRYPNLLNVHLYFHRMLTSGVLAILGSLILLAGFSYINFNYTDFTVKHKILFAISSILIGLYQHKFIKRINNIFDKLYKPEDKIGNKKDKKDGVEDNKTNDGIINQIGK